MSDSVGPHRWQPTRPPCPWDSLGKNTGVGCHFLLQCMKVESESEVAQSCPTLSDLMDCSLPGSSIHGIFQARVLEWGAIAFSGEPFSWCLFQVVSITVGLNSRTPSWCLESWKIGGKKPHTVSVRSLLWLEKIKEAINGSEPIRSLMAFWFLLSLLLYL